jgi:murein DD-endopeptidase MepM/ murein hydrolase activator NlpD
MTTKKKIEIAPPVKDSPRVSQEFGENPAVYKQFGLAGHNGIDYAVPEGTPIYACDYGVVEVLNNDKTGYGLHIRIKHDWGVSLYGHLLSALVVRDCYITRGQVIGRSNNTGFSTGNHLHFGIKIDGVKNPGFGDWLDPKLYFENTAAKKIKICGWITPKK